jgi:hypothetical protein
MSEGKRKPVVGDRIWWFNINRRRYLDRHSGPIWRYHWEPCVIVGETRVSWLVGYDHSSRTHHKCPKKGYDPRIWAFSEAEIDEQEWVQDHRSKIANEVHRCSDPAKLRKIAEILEWKPKA